MATNKKTVSVYADDDLLTALEEFKDSGNHKSLNVAIVAILREKLFGESSGNIQSTLQSKVSSTLDIEGIVNDAVESRLEAVLTQVEGLRLELHSVKTSALLYEKLQSDVSILQGDIDIKLDRINNTIANIEATVSAKKPLTLSQNQKVIAIQKLQATA
jgi:ABC-type phosphate transport system auxiliary subunit